MKNRFHRMAIKMTLTERLENLLQRQIDWFDETLAWYGDLDRAMGTEAYDEMLVKLAQHEKAIAAFTREREILEKELKETGVNALPESLMPMSKRATALAHELGERQSAAAARTTEAAHHIQEELGTLQRGRSMVEGYRAGNADGVQWLDQKG